jgi:predicted chitinase
MRGVAKVIGPANPKIGETNFYEVASFHPGTVVTNTASIKWKLFQFKDNKWVEVSGPAKIGKKVTYSFPQKWYGKKLLIEAYLFEPEIKSPPGHIVRPVLGPKKIVKTEILNSQGKPITEKPKYGQSIMLKVATENMPGETLKLSLWERDTFFDGGHDPSSNQQLWSGEAKVQKSDGIVEKKIVLTLELMRLSNKGYMYEGGEHEYYLLVEASKMKTISQTAQIANQQVDLSGKKPAGKPAAKPATPKAKEEPSIMDQVTVMVENVLSWDPFNIRGTSKGVVDDLGDKEKNKKKGNCFCNRDITTDELKKMVKNIRDSTFYEGKTITYYHQEKLFYLYAKVPQGDRTMAKFAEVLNKAFSKYEINTCVRKIHFLANMYVETMYFTATREGKGINSFRYDPYRGRGFQHLTWRENYQAYEAASGNKVEDDYEKVADDLNIAADSGAWYWKKTGINAYADKDSIFDTARLINLPGAKKSSSINGYVDRETAWRELKKIFKYPQECVSKTVKPSDTGATCPTCKTEHFDLTGTVAWQTQFNPKWGTQKQQNVACKKTCDAILISVGLTSTSKFSKHQTALENHDHTELLVDTNVSKIGIKYLDLQLKEGNPVQVGVDHDLNYKGGTLNEGTTDHFVVIVGKSCDKGRVYYRFYDVGTRFEAKGKSEDNRLYLNLSDYSLKGKTVYNGHNYTVTQIRNNQKK